MNPDKRYHWQELLHGEWNSMTHLDDNWTVKDLIIGVTLGEPKASSMIIGDHVLIAIMGVVQEYRIDADMQTQCLR